MILWEYCRDEAGEGAVHIREQVNCSSEEYPERAQRDFSVGYVFRQPECTCIHLVDLVFTKDPAANILAWL